MSLQTDLINQAYGPYFQALSTQLGIGLGALVIFLVIVALWSLIWKGLALWKSSRKGSWVWFVIMLILNDLGIIEILYIFIFSKLNPNRNSKKKARKNN